MTPHEQATDRFIRAANELRTWAGDHPSFSVSPLTEEYDLAHADFVAALRSEPSGSVSDEPVVWMRASDNAFMLHADKRAARPYDYPDYDTPLYRSSTPAVPSVEEIMETVAFCNVDMELGLSRSVLQEIEKRLRSRLTQALRSPAVDGRSGEAPSLPSAVAIAPSAEVADQGLQSANAPAREIARCGLCGEPLPEGEEMFIFHGTSGPCPK